ncbi:MAG: hypothetical protein KF821_08970 [Anaerolineales bacterium]|nr:hypothetical protein [Anaerolineales bacterium]
MANGETFDTIRKLVDSGPSGEGLSRKQTDLLLLAAQADIHAQVKDLHTKIDKEVKPVRQAAYLALAASFVALFLPDLRDVLVKAFLALFGL